MNDNPTRVLSQILALGTNPDDIKHDDGDPFIVLGPVTLVIDLSSQAALDKLATVTAQAAADHRARLLRKVA